MGGLNYLHILQARQLHSDNCSEQRENEMINEDVQSMTSLTEQYSRSAVSQNVGK